MMPLPLHTFDTPEAITVEVVVDYGQTRVIASDRKTTVVDVRPARESRRSDVEAAERTTVHFAAGRLEVRAPKARGLALLGRQGAVDVVLQLPSGSDVRVQSAYGDITAEGRLGDCFLKTSYGTVDVDEVGAATLETSAGDITAERVTGAAELKTSTGDLRIGESGRSTSLKTSTGDIRVEKAGESVNARTAYGAIRIGTAARGQLDLNASYGDIEVGVGHDTATFLELSSEHGRVRNELSPVADTLEPGDRLKVHAQVGYGDIRIRRDERN